MRRRALLFLVVGLVYTLPAMAQDTGRLIGVVRDESRGVLPSTIVTVTSPSMPGGPSTVVANEQGEYRFVDLPSGVYMLTATLSGFGTYEEADLRVVAGGTTERNFTLPLATVSATITVSGQSPVVDTRRAGIVETQPVEVVEAIPLERRSNTDYVSRLPGATTSSYNATNGVNIMGSSNSEIAMTQDGAAYNSVMSGGSYPVGDIDAVQEVSVTMLGASAEFQQAQGGVLNIVNKSGTNQFRGDGRYYWLDKNQTSVPFTLPCNCPEGQTGFKWYRNDDYSLHGGGPIVKNRLWYFVGGTKISWQYRNPGQAAQPTNVDWYQRYDDRASGKVTWKINDKMTFNQTALYEWWQYLGAFPSLNVPLDASYWYAGDIRLFGSELTRSISSTSLLTAHYSYFYMPSSVTGMGPNLTKHDITTPATMDLATGITSGNYFITGATPYSTQLPRRHSADVKFSKYLAGRRASHNLRFGGQFVHNYNLQELVYPGGVRYETLNGAPHLALFTNPSAFTAETRAFGVWVEDELNIGQRLTIQPGVRFDNMKSISPDYPSISGSSLLKAGTPLAPFYGFLETGTTHRGVGTLFTWNVWSPRVGANLKLTADGRTVLRGTIGRYYRPSFINDFINAAPGIPATTTMGWSPATSSYSTFISTVTPNANIRISPDTKAPYTTAYSIGMDREVAHNMAVSVSFAYKTWGDLEGWTDIGGVYGTKVVSTPQGPLTVFPLLSPTSSRVFLLNTQPNYFETYRGLITQLTKRLSNRWFASIGYTYSQNNQLALGGLTTNNGGQSCGGLNCGQDPNDLINAEGPAGLIDRPHVTNAQASYLIPKIDLQVATNIALASGQPYGASQNVSLPQGTRAIFIQPPGTYRTPFQRYMMLRIDKSFTLRSNRLDAIGEIRNLLNEESDGSVTSTIYAASTFGVPNAWAWPRRLYIGVRCFFR